MLISKFDLYKPEWLELVFDNRNKDYGAYDLRRHYASNMVNAMGITFFGVAVLFTASVILRNKAVPVAATPRDPVIVVNLAHPPITPPKPVDPPKALPRQTTAVLPPVVRPDIDIRTAPVENAKVKGDVGQVTTPGTSNVPVIIEMPPGPPAQPEIDNKVRSSGEVDVMPAPVGGEEAWAKFLNKNLRFPSAAREDGVSGRVTLSFVIEKDGQLSNIAVERPAGHGFDEEALRVLKLAKAWKPGKQNGQAVRVKYYIPINFQLANE
jgi:protein TonB